MRHESKEFRNGSVPTKPAQAAGISKVRASWIKRASIGGARGLGLPIHLLLDGEPNC
jgi:hypothetical protein